MTRIIDSRSESRKDFLIIKFNDPRIKLQELSITLAKERRQKWFEQNREISKTMKEKEEKKVSKDQTKIIKELTTAMNIYQNITSLEKENMKKIKNQEWKYHQRNKKNYIKQI